MTTAISRRRIAALLAGAGIAAACETVTRPTVGAFDGKLAARPVRVTTPGAGRGVFRLDAWPRPLVFVPPGLDASKPASFILLLHGGGSNAE